jgi:hypothetical protein
MDDCFCAAVSNVRICKSRGRACVKICSAVDDSGWTAVIGEGIGSAVSDGAAVTVEMAETTDSNPKTVARKHRGTEKSGIRRKKGKCLKHGSTDTAVPSSGNA